MKVSKLRVSEVVSKTGKTYRITIPKKLVDRSEKLGKSDYVRLFDLGGALLVMPELQIFNIKERIEKVKEFHENCGHHFSRLRAVANPMYGEMSSPAVTTQKRKT